MNAQANVNQLLGLGAVALRLGPGFEQRAELKNIDKNIRTLGKAGKQDVKKYGVGTVLNAKNSARITDPGVADVAKARTERLVQHAELSEKRAKISPTAKFTKDAQFWKQRAMQDLQTKGQMQVFQKEEFEALLERLGGKNEQK